MLICKYFLSFPEMLSKLSAADLCIFGSLACIFMSSLTWCLGFIGRLYMTWKMVVINYGFPSWWSLSPSSNMDCQSIILVINEGIYLNGFIRVGINTPIRLNIYPSNAILWHKYANWTEYLPKQCHFMT